MSVVEIIETKNVLAQLQLHMRRDTLRDFEITIQHPQEGQRLVKPSASASIIRDTLDEPMAYVCMAQDVTERKRAQKALEISEIRFRRLLDSNIIGFMRVDFDGHILEANDAFLTMLGYNQEDLTTGRISGVAMTPNEYDAVDEWIARKIKNAGRLHGDR